MGSRWGSSTSRSGAFGGFMSSWGGFAVGLGLMVAPLLAGYHSAGAVLHDVAMGLLLCVVTLAALEWPRVRLTMAAPALWLVAASRTNSEGAAAVAELTAGGLVLVFLLLPRRRAEGPAARLARPARRAGVRA